MTVLNLVVLINSIVYAALVDAIMCLNLIRQPKLQHLINQQTVPKFCSHYFNLRHITHFLPINIVIIIKTTHFLKRQSCIRIKFIEKTIMV